MDEEVRQLIEDLEEIGRTMHKANVLTAIACGVSFAAMVIIVVMRCVLKV